MKKREKRFTITDAGKAALDASAAQRKDDQAALGRSPAVLPCQNGANGKESSKPAKRKAQKPAPARVLDTPVTQCDVTHAPTAAGPAIPVCVASAHRFLKGVCAWCGTPEPPRCPACRTLLLELSQAVKDFRTLSRPMLAQYASLSFGQVKAFEQSLAPLGARVRAARAAYEKHIEKAGHE